MSQLSLNYRESPLSVADGRPGEIHAGDRIPDLLLVQLSKPSEKTHELQTNLFRLLSPDRFTLLYANITSPEKTHQQVQSLLSPWKHLVQGYQVSSVKENDRLFKRLFGTDPAILLIRPDSYVAFTGSEQSVPALANYLKQWFPTQPPSADRENEHARTYGLLERSHDGLGADSHL